MGHRTHRMIRTVGLVATTLAAGLAAAAPGWAAAELPWHAEIAGNIQITGVGPNGPTSAVYGGQGRATVLGATRMDGLITVVGPADCEGGFLATHEDTLTASNGDQLYVTISDTSCPRSGSPGTFDCTGSYTVTGGTGRFSNATGSGDWSGSVTFGPTGSGTFNTSYSGTVSGP